MEADYVAAKAELANLQLREKQLEARVALLKRVATLNDAEIIKHAVVSTQT